MDFLIVQKKSLLRDYLEKIIRNNGNNFLSVENEAELNFTYWQYKPAYVILDIDSININGLKLAEKLKKKDPDSRLLLISDNDNNWLRKKYNNITNSIFIPKENLHQIELIIDFKNNKEEYK